MEGECLECPNYTYPDEDGINCLERTECGNDFYITTDGKCKNCSDFRGLQAFDDIGQIHCNMIPNAVDFKETYEIPICMSGWFSERKKIGCPDCPDHTQYNYVNDECEKTTCESNSFISKNGYCEACPPNHYPNESLTGCIRTNEL
mmetsp:Transcript_10680/g.17937  ORF Transcript_10680/g.17937 Transcript_10680/m.17937 type:complete len:146 (+) Transcript_10680:776-1213(+)